LIELRGVQAKPGGATINPESSQLYPIEGIGATRASAGRTAEPR
jgi:hypothetical protein